jgi:hypothetical protein
MAALLDKDCEIRSMSSVGTMEGSQPKDNDAYTTTVESTMALHSFVLKSTTIHHHHYVFANELSLGAEHIQVFCPMSVPQGLNTHQTNLRYLLEKDTGRLPAIVRQRHADS